MGFPLHSVLLHLSGFIAGTTHLVDVRCMIPESAEFGLDISKRGKLPRFFLYSWGIYRKREITSLSSMSSLASNKRGVIPHCLKLPCPDHFPPSFLHLFPFGGPDLP